MLKFHHSSKLVEKWKIPWAKYEFGCVIFLFLNWKFVIDLVLLPISLRPPWLDHNFNLTFNIQPAVGLVLLPVLHKLHDLTAPSACRVTIITILKMMAVPASSSSQVLKTRASFSPLSTRLIRPSAGKLNAVPFFSHLNFWHVFGH